MATGIMPPLREVIALVIKPGAEALIILGAQRLPLAESMIILAKRRKRRDKGKTDKLAMRLIIQLEKPVFIPGKAPRPIWRGARMIFKIMLT